MVRLHVEVKQCVSCGICMDVCVPRAIAMRSTGSRTVEGLMRSHYYVNTNGGMETEAEVATAFPYLAIPERCDGCGECVAQCPVLALQLLSEGGVVEHLTILPNRSAG